jgi:hypothetical protein
MRTIGIVVYIVLATCSCSTKNRIRVTNTDDVPLEVSVEVSDGSFSWREVVVHGATATLSVSVNGEALLRTEVYFNGGIVQSREKGYLSESVGTREDTCVVVSRQRIDVRHCK